MTNDTRFGDALIEALEEAVAYEGGELPGTRVDRVEITARGARVPPAPEYSADEIRAIRHGLSLSQQVFADLLNASASSVRAWEQGTREPDGPTRRLLQVAKERPDALLGLLEQDRPRPYPRIEPRALKAAEPHVPYGTPRKRSSKT
jgi:putative transcriptional regulator